MGVLSNYFPLGLGTSRFPISGPNDIAGIEKSINITSHALDAGINYVDTAYSYSAGMAQTVLKEAFAQAKKPFDVTVKVMLEMDKTADDARRRVELQLKAMGLSKARFFTCWTIFTYTEFEQIMQKGGIYEGAQKLKDEGLIDHICFSTHAQPADIIRILQSDAFEGLTLSYNITNATIMQPVLDTALKHNIDVAVMNPLGGGVIPQQAEYFGFAQGESDKNIVQAAIRFAKSHPAVKVVLSGFSSEGEIGENIAAFSDVNTEDDTKRFTRVMKEIRTLDNFCTGCNYCEGCPVNIPISEIMRKRNSLLFTPKDSYNRKDPELVKNIKLFYAHVSANEWFPNSAENPCVRCGQCEAKCTQRLNIIEDLSDVYERVAKVGFSVAARKERLQEMLTGKNYKRVGLYPNGGFANQIVSLYGKFFGEPAFEWLQFNSDPKMWGEMSGGLPVYSPNDIPSLKPDTIIICTYKYDAEIYESLRHHEDAGIKIEKLHKPTDVPWVF